jgi:hypothetical protein
VPSKVRLTPGKIRRVQAGCQACRVRLRLYTAVLLTASGVENEICWRNLGSSTIIAETFVWYFRSTGQIAQADMIFNNGFSWSYNGRLGACTSYTACDTDSSGGTFDVRDIATHEFGHYLALLGDLYSAQDNLLTMYGYSSEGEVHKDSLARVIVSAS